MKLCNSMAKSVRGEQEIQLNLEFWKADLDIVVVHSHSGVHDFTLLLNNT